MVFRCNYCNRAGHRDDSCMRKPAVCHMCGNSGHYESRCPSKICVNVSIKISLATFYSHSTRRKIPLTVVLYNFSVVRQITFSLTSAAIALLGDVLLAKNASRGGTRSATVPTCGDDIIIR